MQTQAKSVALIPARGGSKGLPGKNIRELHGKPMIAYTIEAALQCPGVNRVYVSTDCPNIAAISRQHGATVLERPDELATDTASTMDVVRHFLDWNRATQGTEVATLILLQPTSPLRTNQHLLEALALYQSLPQPASLVAVSPAKPLSWQGFLDNAQRFRLHEAPDPNGNRQSESRNYVLNGAIYIAPPERYTANQLTSDPVYAYTMPAEASVDIDTLSDFHYAEALMNEQLYPSSP